MEFLCLKVGECICGYVYRNGYIGVILFYFSYEEFLWFMMVVFRQQELRGKKKYGKGRKERNQIFKFCVIRYVESIYYQENDQKQFNIFKEVFVNGSKCFRISD